MSDPTVTGPVLTGTPPKTPPSPKVIFAAVGAFLIPLALLALASLLTALGGELHWILEGLPVFAQALIVQAAGGLAAYIAGYLKRDAVRELGARAQQEGITDL